MIDYEALAVRAKQFIDSVPVTIDTMPISTTKGLCLRSSISGDNLDHELPGFMKGAFRLIVRSAKYAEGMKLVDTATAALTVDIPQDVGFMHVRYCRARTTPMIYPVSDGNLREFAVNMDICYDYIPGQDIQTDFIKSTELASYLEEKMKEVEDGAY